MRFRRLELVRYGAFADRTIDFGDGEVDLHIVVGANEAGKSTMLEAIGDFLFGIPMQSRQGWKFGNGELRLRAVLEDGDRTVDLIRRKGSKNTLLMPTDDSAAGDDALESMLGGLDRKAFQRMYGLNHAELRAGGDMILEGRDDAARIVLEAGSGLAGLGDALKAYDKTSGELFKSGGQNPLVNVLLREREAAKGDVRDALIGEVEWTGVREKETAALAQRAALDLEAHALEVRTAALARIQRVRGPLARLAQIESEIDALGPVVDFRDDVEERMAEARETLRIVDVKWGPIEATLTKAQKTIAETVISDPLLAHALDVEALEERRPVVEQAARDLGHRKSELAEAESAIALSCSHAGLLGEDLPSPGWLKRARQWLDDEGVLVSDQRRHADTLNELKTQQRASDDVAPSPAAEHVDGLKAALAVYPDDAEERLAELQRAVTRTATHADRLTAALAPWSGTPDSLRAICIPVDAVVAEHKARIDKATMRSDEAIADQTAAAKRMIIAEAALAKLLVAGDVPTLQAIAAVRGHRDLVLADVRERLVAIRPKDDDGDRGAELAEAVIDADRVADARDAQAARVAEHGLATFELKEASALHEAASKARTEWTTQRIEAEEAWSGMLTAIGFGKAIPPTAMAGWCADRLLALTAHDDVVEAAGKFAERRGKLDAAMGRIRAAARAVEPTEAEPEAAMPVDIVDGARAVLARADAAAKAHERAKTLREASDALKSAAETEAASLGERRRGLDGELVMLLKQGSLAPAAGRVGLSDAIEALASVDATIVRRDGFRRQVDGIEREARMFAADVEALCVKLDRPASSAAAAMVRSLSVELAKNEEAARILVLSRTEETDAQALLDDLENDRRLAQDTIDAALRDARVDDAESFVAAIEKWRSHTKLVGQRADAERNLVELSDGVSVERLSADVAGCDPDEAAAELVDIAERKRAIETDREEVGRALAEVEAATARAATGDEAAHAQQRVVEATAQLADAAERHIEAAISAALLRWLIERHRETSQAPLIARAGKVFASVTQGAFDGIGLDYDDDDRPRIVGVREDSSRVDVAGLSEGTRDQLYLALRLASIEGRSAAAVPLVCDDLLITADDERAGAMLHVLAQSAKTTQVMIFTHHEHLVEVARRTLGNDGFKLHRVEPVRVLSQAA